MLRAAPDICPVFVSNWSHKRILVSQKKLFGLTRFRSHKKTLRPKRGSLGKKKTTRFGKSGSCECSAAFCFFVGKEISFELPRHRLPSRVVGTRPANCRTANFLKIPRHHTSLFVLPHRAVGVEKLQRNYINPNPCLRSVIPISVPAEEALRA